MNITIIGTGYVGLVSGVCLASKQHNVTCVDIREEVVNSLNNNKPHIHENGWLSGSIYINVPPKSKIDSGNLVVALGKDSDATNSRLHLKKVIDVVTGSKVLFPASLMHHTIPFESEEERIVLAFDVIPKGSSLAKNRFPPK